MVTRKGIGYEPLSPLVHDIAQLCEWWLWVSSSRKNVSLIYSGFRWGHPLVPWLDEALSPCSLTPCESLSHGTHDSFLWLPTRDRGWHRLQVYLIQDYGSSRRVQCLTQSKPFISICCKNEWLNGWIVSSSVFILLRTVLIQLLPRQISLIFCEMLAIRDIAVTLKKL